MWQEPIRSRGQADEAVYPEQHGKRQSWPFISRLLIVLAIMLDTIRRMFNGVTPFDLTMLIVEILVLALIGGEQIIRVWHHARIRRRSAQVSKSLVDGESLYTNVPHSSDPATQGERAREWIGRVDAWVNTTNQLLVGYSLEASAAFLHSSGLVFGVKPGINHYAQQKYTLLQERLNGLHIIMGNPDVYF